MREHYQRHQNYDSFLHNDYQIEFIDIIPPDGWEIKRLQDIFYPALAFELLDELLDRDNKTKGYKFEYRVDDYRNQLETINLSCVWDKALEQLASRKDLAEALDEKLKSAIADLTNDPRKWNNYYLPKLQQFENKVENLPKEDPNYLYRNTVIGVKASADSPRQDGIINRFWKKMQVVVREEMAKQKQQQQAAQISAANSMEDTALLEAKTSFDSTEPSSVPVVMQPDINEIIDAEEIEQQKAGVSTRKPLSIEQLELLERMASLLEKNQITEAEYQAFKQDLFGN